MCKVEQPVSAKEKEIIFHFNYEYVIHLEEKVDATVRQCLYYREINKWGG
jgi:hypothetical protein